MASYENGPGGRNAGHRNSFDRIYTERSLLLVRHARADPADRIRGRSESFAVETGQSAFEP